MIRYTLKCSSDHQFDSWFPSAGAFDAQQASGLVQCPACGSDKVEKTLMAPAVRPARDSATAAPPPSFESGSAASGALSKPGDPREQALAELRRKIEESADYVGLSFGMEARRMHSGEVPERAIYGEVTATEARELIEDGVPVAPLPFMPTRKTN
jgi:hypothetical protein